MSDLSVLIVTSEWPTAERTNDVPFIVEQVESIKRRGINVDVFAFRGGKSPFNYIRSWLKLRQQYNLGDYDLIHAHFGQASWVCLPAPCPILVTYWGSDLHGYLNESGQYTVSGKILGFINRFTSRLVAGNIAVSNHLLNYLPRHVPHYVITPGVDFDLFRPIEQKEVRERLNLPLDKKLVLFPANPARPVKRYYLAKEAVKHLKESFNVDLIALNNISPHLVPLYMNASDALVLTSAHEGSPTVVKEALACNLPVVSVDVGDVRERLEGLTPCIVCEDDSSEAIAVALHKTLSYTGPVDFRRYIDDLDVNFTAGKIVKVYEKTSGKVIAKEGLEWK